MNRLLLTKVIMLGNYTLQNIYITMDNMILYGEWLIYNTYKIYFKKNVISFYFIKIVFIF